MNTERLIHMPQCSTVDLSALCNSSNSIWKTIESHRWVKLSCENIGMCLSYVPFTLVIRLITCWDFIQIWYDNKMLSSQWDNDNQHFVYIIVSWYLLGIITRQGFLFSCSCMNRCTCSLIKSASQGSVLYHLLSFQTDRPFQLANRRHHAALWETRRPVRTSNRGYWARAQLHLENQILHPHAVRTPHQWRQRNLTLHPEILSQLL